MIHVIASVRVRTGMRSAFLAVLKANVPEVRKEKGCIEYCAVIDRDANLPPQVLDDNVVTILEKWDGLDDLKAHLGSRHMREYREKVKNLVEQVTIKVLQEV